MNQLLTLFSHLSAQATGALISAVWQGALLAALVVICLRLFPGLSAAARSIIWLNVFILLALLHLLPFLVANRSVPQFSSHPLQIDLRWSVAVAAVSLALSLFRAVQLVVSAVHLRALAGRATRVEIAPDLDPLLRAPGNRRVQLCASNEVARPSVLGFFRPRILVPPVLLDGLAPAELRQVVIHEMEHLRRGDDWTNLLQKLALVLFPLNPALLWVERRLCAERELACDDHVLNSGSGRKAYALCLTHLAEYSLMRRGFSLVLGAWERRPELVRRVHRILTQPSRTMGRKPALAVCATLIAGALGCTLALVRAPQFVSFVPPANASEQAQAFPQLDPAALAGALGGTPHKVKVVMPCQAHQQVIRIKAQRKRRALPQLQPVRLASLRVPPPSNANSPREVMVTTQWTEMRTADGVVYAVSRQQIRRAQANGTPRIQSPASPQVISGVYVVRTPNGWLIIQI
jgi:beta-lactamase regulating signal transducer with metallopeptidase domain